MIVGRGLLHEPFRLVDIGVQDGVHTRWLALGDCLDVSGFDPLPDVIEALKAANPRHRYYAIGIGNEDGERLFERTPNACGSAFLPLTATEADIGRDKDGNIPANWHRAQIRRLDTLHAQRWFAGVDFLKLDCEGFETNILRGARQFLRESGVFGIESETHFFANPQFPRSHFVELYEQLVPFGFEVYDFGFYRVPEVRGQPNSFDFLFLGPAFKADTEPSVDRLIKMLVTCEVCGFPYLARRLIAKNKDRLGARLDCDAALRCFEERKV
jgi:FkbM family methyltransferase